MKVKKEKTLYKKVIKTVRDKYQSKPLEYMYLF